MTPFFVQFFHVLLVSVDFLDCSFSQYVGGSEEAESVWVDDAAGVDSFSEADVQVGTFFCGGVGVAGGAIGLGETGFGEGCEL